jgi:hypothetical protein
LRVQRTVDARELLRKRESLGGTSLVSLNASKAARLAMRDDRIMRHARLGLQSGVDVH